MPIDLIRNPQIYQEGPGSNTPCTQKDPLFEAGFATPGAAGGGAWGTAQAWLAGSLVRRLAVAGPPAASRLERVPNSASATDKTYGMSPAAAKGSGTPAALMNPPFALFGPNHYCFDIRDRILVVNIGTATDANLGTNVGVTYNGGGTGGVLMFPGFKCALRVVAAGTFTGVQIANVADTTNTFFEVVACCPDTLPDNNNTRTLVKVIDANIEG